MKLDPRTSAGHTKGLCLCKLHALSLSLSSLSLSVAVQVVNVLLLVCREVIVLEQTPEIIECPAQPATILPAHTQARTTFAAPITLATLRI